MQLKRFFDAGSRVSMLTFSANNEMGARRGKVLKPQGIDLYAANGKTIKPFGIAENIKLQLDGYELEANLVIVDDTMGVEDFLLGRNFQAPIRSWSI